MNFCSTPPIGPNEMSKIWVKQRGGKIIEKSEFDWIAIWSDKIEFQCKIYKGEKKEMLLKKFTTVL